MLVMEAKFLKAKLLLNEDIFEEAQEGFAEAYNKVCETVPEHEREVLQGAMEQKDKKESKKKSTVSKAGKNAKKNKKNKQKKEKEQEEEEQEEEDDRQEVTKNPKSNSVKRIYRAIAKESHPDKLMDVEEEEAAKKKKLFREAQRASEQANLLELIEIAEILNIIPPDPEEEHLDILEQNVKDLKSANKMITDTTAWRWHKEESPEMKEAILIRYMQYIYTTFK